MSANDANAGPTFVGSDILDTTGTVIADAACRRCGYNLRGLQDNGRCPECGTPVGLSTHGELLRYADPQWVEKLAKGMSIILWGIVLGFVGGCLAGVAGARGGGSTLQRLIAASGQFVGVIGAWILTTPDPSGIGEDRYVNARKVVRIGLMFGVVGQLLGIVQDAVSSGVPQVLVIIITLACGLIAAAGTYAEYLYIEKLAERIPDRKLAGLARFLRWGYSIVIGATAVLGGIAALVYIGGGPTAAVAGGPSGATITLGSPAARVTTVLGAGVCFFGLAAVVFMILCIVLYVKAMKAFRQQAEYARATWAAATGAEVAPPAKPIIFGPPPVPPQDTPNE